MPWLVTGMETPSGAPCRSHLARSVSGSPECSTYASTMLACMPAEGCWRVPLMAVRIVSLMSAMSWVRNPFVCWFWNLARHGSRSLEVDRIAAIRMSWMTLPVFLAPGTLSRELNGFLMPPMASWFSFSLICFGLITGRPRRGVS